MDPQSGRFTINLQTVRKLPLCIRTKLPRQKDLKTWWNRRDERLRSQVILMMKNELKNGDTWVFDLSRKSSSINLHLELVIKTRKFLV